jgi:hypothetical protein
MPAQSLRQFVVPFDSAAIDYLRTLIERTNCPRLPTVIGCS